MKQGIMAADCSLEIKQLAMELHDLCLKRGYRIGTAESCTGGMIAGAITAVPGSSEYFLGGIVSYASSVKMSVLGVPGEILNINSSVSSECAEAMALGAARVLNVNCAVSVTGIAGPGGGTDETPVGTVWFGLSVNGRTHTEKRLFDGDRDEVRRQTVLHALRLVIKAMAEDWRW